MIGYYNYTVILTYLGMLVGFTGIGHVLKGDLRAALICLFISGVCDMFDGKLASTRKRTREEKRFGVQIDSLSDLVCFGVLPAAAVCLACGMSRMSFCLGALYLLCALIRLAWFNVDEEKRQDREDGRRTVYHGLPVTAAALIFPALLGLGEKCRWPLQILGPVLLLLTAAAFLTPFRLKKPVLRGKDSGPELPSAEEPERLGEWKA